MGLGLLCFLKLWSSPMAMNWSPVQMIWLNSSLPDACHWRVHSLPSGLVKMAAGFLKLPAVMAANCDPDQTIFIMRLFWPMVEVSCCVQAMPSELVRMIGPAAGGGSLPMATNSLPFQMTDSRLPLTPESRWLQVMPSGLVRIGALPLTVMVVGSDVPVPTATNCVSPQTTSLRALFPSREASAACQPSRPEKLFASVAAVAWQGESMKQSVIPTITSWRHQA